MNRSVVSGSCAVGGLGKQSSRIRIGRSGTGRRGKGRDCLFQDTVDEGTKFQLFENLAELFFVRLFADECIHVELDRYVHFDGCKEFGESNHFPVCLYFGFKRTFQPVGMGKQVFDAAEFSHQLLCGFLSHARTAGDVIGRVAHQSQHVDDLLCGLDIELRFYLLDAHDFESAAVFGAVHEYILRYQLAVVFVGRHHVSDNTLSAGFGGKRAYYVVGFITGHFQDRNAVGADNILYNRYGKTDSLGSLFPLRFVLFVSLVAECRSRRVESYSYMCGIFLFQHLFQGVHKPQNGGSVESFGVDSRIFDERVISTVYQCVGIKQEKFIG